MLSSYRGARAALALAGVVVAAASCSGGSGGSDASGASDASATSSGSTVASAPAATVDDTLVAGKVALAVGLTVDVVQSAFTAMAARTPDVPAATLVGGLGDYLDGQVLAGRGGFAVTDENRARDPTIGPWPGLCADTRLALATTSDAEFTSRLESLAATIARQWPEGAKATGSGVAAAEENLRISSIRLTGSGLSLAAVNPATSGREEVGTLYLLILASQACPA